MRIHQVFPAALAAAVLGCSDSDVPAACEPPAGCVTVERLAGECTCSKWQVASVRAVRLPYLVVWVADTMPGSASIVSYGHWAEPADADTFLGSRWRTVVRADDGSETVATPTVLDMGDGNGLSAVRVTAASVMVGLASVSGINFSTWVDVPPEPHDVRFEVWVNPVATVTTDVAGNRTVDWSWDPAVGSATGAAVLTLTASELASGTSASAARQLFLDGLTAAERTDLLRYYPLYDPPGRDPLTLSQDPRFLHVSSSGFSYGTDASPDVGWTPCAGTLDDAVFPVLAEQEAPIGESGDTLLLQHSVQRLCQLQNPVVQLGTRTEGCGMQVDLYVDRVFGTLVPVAGEVGASCTRP